MSTAQQIEDRIVAAQAAIAVLQAQILADVAVYDQNEWWKDDGMRNVADWFTYRCNVSPTYARRVATSARKAAEHPEALGTLAAGDISFDQAVPLLLLLERTDATGDREREVVKRSAGMSVSDLERSARLAHRPDAESEGNELSMLRYRRERDAGRVKLWADLDAVDGETVIAALERRAQQLFEAVPAGSLPRPWGERMATALVDQSAQQISADADPDRATVVVHVDASTGVAETEGGMVLDRSALEQMMCDARYQTVTHHSDRVVASTVIVDPPRWMRRLVINRDGGCMWPGCSNAIRYQVHHMRHVEHGGPTEMWNLVCLCTFHHKVVHRDHWTIRRLPDDSLVFIPERGRVLSKGPPVRRFLQD